MRLRVLTFVAIACASWSGGCVLGTAHSGDSASENGAATALGDEVPVGNVQSAIRPRVSCPSIRPLSPLRFSPFKPVIEGVLPSPDPWEPPAVAPESPTPDNSTTSDTTVSGSGSGVSETPK